MTPAQRERVARLLDVLEAEIRGKGARKVEPNRTTDADIGRAEDEQPHNEMLQAIASNRNKNQDVILARIDKAVRKLGKDDGEFGICEGCEENIPFARLQIMPYTELCVACQGQRDAPTSGPTRRKLTDYG